MTGPSPEDDAGETSTPPTEAILAFVADEIAEIRAKIRELKAREEELRPLVISYPEARKGSLYDLSVTTKVQTHLNAEALRRAFPAIAKQFTRKIEVTFIRVSKHGECDE